jgi:hypothetical protein
MSDKGFVTVVCEVALSNMFGYSTDLRSSTQVLLPPSLAFTSLSLRTIERCDGVALARNTRRHARDAACRARASSLWSIPGTRRFLKACVGVGREDV